MPCFTSWASPMYEQENSFGRCSNQQIAPCRSVGHQTQNKRDDAPLACAHRSTECLIIVSAHVVSVNIRSFDNGHNARRYAAQYHSQHAPQQIRIGARRHTVIVVAAILAAALLISSVRILLMVHFAIRVMGRIAVSMAPVRWRRRLVTAPWLEKSLQFRHRVSRSPVGHSRTPHQRIGCNAIFGKAFRADRPLLLVMMVKVKVIVHIKQVESCVSIFSSR